MGQQANATQTERAIATLYALTGSFDAPGGNVVLPAHRLNPVTDHDQLPPPSGPRRWAGAPPAGPALAGLDRRARPVRGRAHRTALRRAGVGRVREQPPALPARSGPYRRRAAPPRLLRAPRPLREPDRALRRHPAAGHQPVGTRGGEGRVRDGPAGPGTRPAAAAHGGPRARAARTPSSSSTWPGAWAWAARSSTAT
ncbi:hypothetical protein NKH77_47905 [Streptomyces sp. M19]